MHTSQAFNIRSFSRSWTSCLSRDLAKCTRLLVSLSLSLSLRLVRARADQISNHGLREFYCYFLLVNNSFLDFVKSLFSSRWLGFLWMEKSWFHRVRVRSGPAAFSLLYESESNIRQHLRCLNDVYLRWLENVTFVFFAFASSVSLRYHERLIYVVQPNAQNPSHLARSYSPSSSEARR